MSLPELLLRSLRFKSGRGMFSMDVVLGGRHRRKQWTQGVQSSLRPKADLDFGAQFTWAGYSTAKRAGRREGGGRRHSGLTCLLHLPSSSPIGNFRSIGAVTRDSMRQGRKAAAAASTSQPLVGRSWLPPPEIGQPALPHVSAAGEGSVRGTGLLKLLLSSAVGARPSELQKLWMPCCRVLWKNTS